ncbi:MAG: RdgB/HAM1 family non-canonical purine NTP pyrophosphatase [Bacteroidota bacterium]|nr:RdgB/HAM1 family non-canonical purine NTP pyrophosphatase [Bacteroidota bacterium]
MKQLIIASHNKHKIEEIRRIMPEGYNLLSLNDINYTKEIPETADSFRGNALQKAKTIRNETAYDCFADDSGLEVEILNGKPGVFSARYAGEDGNHKKNNEKLLKELSAKSNRKAQFKTVIALILDGKEYFFEGIVKGKIITELKGKEGFGYDPLFVADGYKNTFAQMNAELKNKISHRANALKEMIEFLEREKKRD